MEVVQTQHGEFSLGQTRITFRDFYITSCLKLPQDVSGEAEGYGGVTGLFPFSYTVPPSPRRAAEALNFAGFMKADFLCKTSRAS